MRNESHRRSRQPAFPAEFKERAALTILAGALLFVLSVFLTWVLWEMGWFAAASAIAVFGGVMIMVAGFDAAKRERLARSEWPRAVAEHEEIARALQRVKSEGGDPRRWLIQSGFEHLGIRKHLLKTLRKPLERPQR